MFMRPTEYLMAVILHSCSMTVSLATQADFKIIDQTNYTITAQCQLVAPLGQRFVKDVPLLEVRGGDPFEFIQIQAVLGDRFRGYQFPDENRVLLWAAFLIRNFTHSDLLQSNFDCYQNIYGKNMSIGCGLRTLTEDTNRPSNTYTHATYTFTSNSNCYWIGVLISAVLTPLATLLGFLIRKYWKQICGIGPITYRTLKSLVHRDTTQLAPTTPDLHSIPTMIDMESEDSKENFAPRVGTQSKPSIQPRGSTTSENPISIPTTQPHLLDSLPEELHEHGETSQPK